MKSSLFSYAMEEKKLYILMFCAFLHHIRKSSNWCAQVSWASPCSETKLTMQPCWSKIHFACFCCAQPCVALEMLILIVSRQMANVLSENYRKLAKLSCSLEVIPVLVPPCCWTSFWQKSSPEAALERRSHTSMSTPSIWNSNNSTSLDANT